MKVNITLSEDDAARLFAIKKLEGKDFMTGEQFAEAWMHKSLYNAFPSIPVVDECGIVLNAEGYRKK